MSINGNASNLVIGVVGAGAMGRGIIQVAATAGFRVIAFDTQPNVAKNSRAFVDRMLHRSVEKRQLDPLKADNAIARIHVVDHLSELASCDIVIEAVGEQLDLKRKVFTELETVVRDEAILASNTSSLSITSLAAVMRKPDRMAGLHFFIPVPLMKLVEVVGGIATSRSTINTLMTISHRLGRQPIECRDSPGFVVNHIGRAFMPESLRIHEEGIANFWDIDKILCDNAHFRLGPFALLDLVGLDVAFPVMESIYNQFYQEPMYKPFVELKHRLDAGMLGRKSNHGFYEYHKDKKVDIPDADIDGPMPSSVWIDNHNPEGAEMIRRAVHKIGIPIEPGTKPSDTSLCLIAPLGEDATTTALSNGLNPCHTVAVDTLLGLSGRRTLMPTLGTLPAYCNSARRLLSIDTPIITVKDSPGFVVQRVVAMLVNVGCRIAEYRVAAPNVIDLGARLGLGYPLGPLELGDKIGAKRILNILEALHDFYGEPRYRPSPWLKRRSMLDMSLRQEEPWL